MDHDDIVASYLFAIVRRQVEFIVQGGGSGLVAKHAKLVEEHAIHILRGSAICIAAQAETQQLEQDESKSGL